MNTKGEMWLMGSLTGAVVFNIVAKYIQYRSIINFFTFLA